MGFTEFDRQKGTPHAFRVAVETVQELFELPKNMEVLEWCHLIDGEVSPRNPDGLREVWFQFHIDKDSEKPLTVVVFLKHEMVSRNIEIEENPSPNRLGVDTMLHLNCKYEDKPVKIEGIVPVYGKNKCVYETT